jgi:hypothetical protein
MEKYLLPEESVISRSPDDQIVVTNFRVRYSTNEGRNLVSLMLDNVDSIRLQYESRPWLVLAGIVCLVAGWVFRVASDKSYVIIAVIAAIACFLLYWNSRRHVITISSASSSILFQIKDMTTDSVLEFINQVEDARKQFLRRKLYS